MSVDLEVLRLYMSHVLAVAGTTLLERPVRGATPEQAATLDRIGRWAELNTPVHASWWSRREMDRRLP